MKKLLIVGCLMAGFFGSAQDRMTPELLWDLKRVGAAQVSPNGQQLFYSIRKYDIKTNTSSSDLFLGDIN